ncbi:hypothetical protein NQ315_013337 [Exocentrus adspersus]|uniref:Uncharacterized protein n=1 Tax=Exocentrus adspersus TaxID=1586481 RepID=A0AAV8V796_9CUCU|nr:hypothetical protein NQ315_013337 [Exocentrus adspersus]
MGLKLVVVVLSALVLTQAAEEFLRKLRPQVFLMKLGPQKYNSYDESAEIKGVGYNLNNSTPSWNVTTPSGNNTTPSWNNTTSSRNLKTATWNILTTFTPWKRTTTSISGPNTDAAVTNVYFSDIRDNVGGAIVINQ